MRLRTRGSGLGAALALAAIGAALLRGRVRRYAVVERSMEPALAPGDYVVAVKKSSHGRGDIVIHPLPRRPQLEVVKRVVGLPGERVAIANGQLHVDGRVLAEPWADGPTFPDAGWRLTDRQIFTLGDSRGRSHGDGRSVGPIGADTAAWRVVWRYWPAARFGRV